MWIYEKKLQYPVKIERPNPRLASVIITALGGPDGELAAATRYLNQRYSMPDGRVIATLTDVGSEELGHMEMVASIVYQLTRNLTDDEIRAGGFDKYYVDHGAAIYPASASGMPFNAACIASKQDALASIHEDLAADAAILHPQRLFKKAESPERDTLKGAFKLNYDCPFVQVMSYDMLRIVMIGFAKFKLTLTKGFGGGLAKCLDKLGLQKVTEPMRGDAVIAV